MKIAFIGQRGIPAYYSGIERRVEELSVRLTRDKHRVFVYSRKKYNPKQPKKYKGVNLIYTPYFNTKSLETISHSFFSTLHALFQNYDIIHYQAPGPSSLCWIAKLLNPKAKIVAAFNSQDKFHAKWGFFAKWYLDLSEKIIAKIPDFTIAGNPIIKKILEKDYHRKTQFIPNGSSIKKTNSQKILKKFNLKPKNYLLTINRLVAHKQIDFLIEAFNEIKEKDLKLVIVGDSLLTHVSDYKEKLKNLSKNNPKIVFTGVLKGQKLAEIFSQAKIFIQPSRAEGFSTVLVEAMSLGLPIIASGIPENQAVLGEKKNALLFKVGNKNDLAKKIQFLIKNPKKAELFAQNARNYAKKHYDWEKIYQKTVRVYEEVLNRNFEPG